MEKNKIAEQTWVIGHSRYFLYKLPDGFYSIHRESTMIGNKLTKERAYKLADTGKRFSDFTTKSDYLTKPY